jgi:hypothetical protein
VWPFGAATTTATSAAEKASREPGNSCDCSASAFADGMPGMLNESLKGFEKLAADPATTTSSASQPAMKRGQRR